MLYLISIQIEYDILQECEMNKLSLRKQRLNNLLNAKRKIEEIIIEDNEVNVHVINPITLKINKATQAFSIKDIVYFTSYNIIYKGE